MALILAAMSCCVGYRDYVRWHCTQSISAKPCAWHLSPPPIFEDAPAILSCDSRLFGFQSHLTGPSSSNVLVFQESNDSEGATHGRYDHGQAAPPHPSSSYPDEMGKTNCKWSLVQPPHMAAGTCRRRAHRTWWRQAQHKRIGPKGSTKTN